MLPTSAWALRAPLLRAHPALHALQQQQRHPFPVGATPWAAVQTLLLVAPFTLFYPAVPLSIENGRRVLMSRSARVLSSLQCRRLMAFVSHPLIKGVEQESQLISVMPAVQPAVRLGGLSMRGVMEWGRWIQAQRERIWAPCFIMC